MTDEANMAKAFADNYTNDRKSLNKGCTIEFVPDAETRPEDNDEEHFLIRFGDGSEAKIYPDMVHLVVPGEYDVEARRGE